MYLKIVKLEIQLCSKNSLIFILLNQYLMFYF